MSKRKLITKKEHQKILNYTGEKGVIGLYITYLGITAIIAGIFLLLFSSYFTKLLSLSIFLIVIGIIAFIIGTITINNGRKETIANNEFQKKTQQEEIYKEKKLQIAEIEKEQLRVQTIANSKIEELENFSGLDFEIFLEELFKSLGYKVARTSYTGDFGADLIIEKNYNKIIVQAKRSSSKISISAVQEIATAKYHYGIVSAWIITNNYFTNPATILAKETAVRLIDRDELAKLILQAKNNSPIENVDTDNKQMPFIEETAQNNIYSHNLYQLVEMIEQFANLQKYDKMRDLLNSVYNLPKTTTDDYISIHFALIRICKCFYKLRTLEPSITDDVVNICYKDITILENLGDKLTNVVCPTLSQLAIILERQKKYQEAISVCDFAIAHNFNENKGCSFAVRKQRLLEVRNKI